MGNSVSGILGLNKSKARRALFVLFFTNPEQEYFPRQLERLTGILVGNLQRELVRMEEAGLFTTRRVGKTKLYKLDAKHPLFPELKSLVTKTVGAQALIRSRLSGIVGVDAACIYGSFAANQESAKSDIDLLIIGIVDEKNLIQAVKGLEKTLQREVNYSLYTPAEWKRRRTSRDSFVTEVIKRPRIAILGKIDGIR